MKKSGLSKNVTTGPTLGYTDILPDRNQWSEVAESMGGEFKVVFTKNHDIEIHRLKIPHKKWILEINISDSRPMKFTSSFKASQDLQMIIGRADFIERFLSRFSKNKVELGWKEFDKHFLIKSKRSDLVKKIITSDIQKSFLKHDIYSLSFTSNHKSDEAEFVSVIRRLAGDKETIIELITTYKQIIDNLATARVIK